MASRLTAKGIDALKPRARQYQVPEGRVPGLALRVHPTGLKRWIFRSKRLGGQFQALGGYPALSIEAARSLAGELTLKIDRGESPAEQRRRQSEAPTLDKLWDEYSERHLPRKAASSQRDDRSRWRRHLSPMGKRKAASITTADLSRLLSRIQRENRIYESNRTLALARHLFAWSIRQGLVEPPNPAEKLQPLREEKRSFVLDDDARGRLLDSIAQEPDPLWQGYFLLLLATGCRRSELLHARWDWVRLDHDPALLVLPAAATKQRQPHLVVLVGLAFDIVEQLPSRGRSLWLFPSNRGEGGPRTEPRAAWARIRRRANLPAMRIHDIRHAVGSLAAALGRGAHTIQHMLGHQQLSTTDRYVHPMLSAVAETSRAVVTALSRPSMSRGDKNG